ncbi:hypothetical protein [Aliikangiella coralliicola]|uniref:Uncharacterized protein n=1 Tax=Aliikangiella coralliicola TaxID=2592383 RepID=A0A545UDQ7_9GAMM|nr:hypothetical protein [Aliikangiella coralliicola]TQV87602.1 hypothetical protein FLL46_12080 [Aliikangiella coralliicola]
MRLLLKMIFVVTLLQACSSEDSSNQSESAKNTIAGPFPKTITGTVEHWEQAGDGKGTILVFLKEFNGAMLVLPENPADPGRVEQAGTRVTFEVDTLSADKCGGSKMQCLSAK